ncbi:DUF3862 domain-containing protein [Clostridium kluyveri]|uniref:DUF3862 domain-containing protein n=1 Tax=Clostridium kluyveri TaxID=1534 RepID=UPI000AD04557|nr:DUF3862 domain-containing protein [Clostridium kluyveri]
MRHKVLSIIIILIVLDGIGSARNNGDDKTATTNSTKQDTTNNATKPKVKDKKYSYDKFMQIEIGMTYEQVKVILGDDTEEFSTGDGETKTIAYRWKNSDGSNLSVTLQGDRVMNKTQTFLQSMDVKITMDKYNQIENRMSYDQVIVDLIGGGEGSRTPVRKTAIAVINPALSMCFTVLY